MSKRVFVTGLGMISAIGNNLAETLSALHESKTGVAEIEYLQTNHRGQIPVAEVKLSNDELGQLSGVDYHQKLSRTSLLGIIAAKEAVHQAGIKDISAYKTGLISATSVGGMDKTELFYADFLDDPQSGDIDVVLSHECGVSTEDIAQVLGISDFVTTISTACSSSANAVMLAARLIRHGIIDRAVVGGTDALTRFTLNGFKTLLILDTEFCQPFDQNRRGLNLGEGAGFLVLESEKIAQKAKILAELTGYANSNDAYHQTASSPEGKGAFAAMQGALNRANLNPAEISYINVHGTGTQNNDLSEGRAIEKLFGDKVPPFSSTKAFTGHTLGAAGGIEAVLSVLSIQQGLIYPNLRFQKKMEELRISPETELQEGQQINHVLSNSFGFGGNSSSLVFSKYSTQ